MGPAPARFLQRCFERWPSIGQKGPCAPLNHPKDPTHSGLRDSGGLGVGRAESLLARSLKAGLDTCIGVYPVNDRNTSTEVETTGGEEFAQQIPLPDVRI